MSLRNKYLSQTSLLPFPQKRSRQALLERRPLLPHLFQERPVIVTGLDHFANRRGEFRSPLDTRPRVADVGYNLVRVLLQDRPELGFEAVRIGELINSIGGEYR